MDDGVRERWIAETTAAFVASGAVEATPATVPRRPEFRRAALSEVGLPSRHEQWSSQLEAAFTSV